MFYQLTIKIHNDHYKGLYFENKNICIIKPYMLFSDSIVSLVGGEHPGEGRVEITLSGVTGTICDNNWDNNEALVVCKMLGYSWYVAEFITLEYS